MHGLARVDALELAGKSGFDLKQPWVWPSDQKFGNALCIPFHPFPPAHVSRHSTQNFHFVPVWRTQVVWDFFFKCGYCPGKNSLHSNFGGWTAMLWYSVIIVSVSAGERHPHAVIKLHPTPPCFVSLYASSFHLYLGCGEHKHACLKNDTVHVNLLVGWTHVLAVLFQIPSIGFSKCWRDRPGFGWRLARYSLRNCVPTIV